MTGNYDAILLDLMMPKMNGLDVLAKLADRGNTVVVIEHNLDVIKVADHIIDIGPEGGSGGGEVIATGTPHQIAQSERSATGEFLRKMGI